jgi:hypothetical protein
MIALGLLFQPAFASDDEHRQHGAHVHGEAALNVSITKNEVYIEFASPAMNIVGFEHEAKTSDEITRARKAIAELNHANELFVFNDPVTCKVASAEVEASVVDHDDHKDHDGEHKDQDDDHEEHDGEHKDQDDDHKDHDDDDHDKETHSDVEATYLFKCKNLAQLSHIQVNLFNTFPGTKELGVNIVHGNKQDKQHLNSKNTKITF